MKKLILTLAIVSQSVFVFAEKTASVKVVRAKNENVKMYIQPGTSTTLLKSLSQTAEIKVVRKHNHIWTIVMVDGQPGYVLTSELKAEHVEMPISKAKEARKNGFAVL